MDDAALRTAPVPDEPAVFSDVVIALAAPMARFSLRARDPGELGRLIGRNVPARIGAHEDGLSCLGPDEWLLRLPAGSTVPLGEGLPVSVTDISERAVCFTIEGQNAIKVLSSGCPRDLTRLPDGYVTRTIYETVEIILWRESATRFAVEVWRSFAPWLWTALNKAAAHG